MLNIQRQLIEPNQVGEVAGKYMLRAGKTLMKLKEHGKCR